MFSNIILSAVIYGISFPRLSDKNVSDEIYA